MLINRKIIYALAVKFNRFFQSSLLFTFMVLASNVFSQQDSTFHIYLMFGQSNMEGQGNIEAQDRVTNARVKMLQDSTCPNLSRVYGTWYTAAPPLLVS